jgi:hypothetical protein
MTKATAKLTPARRRASGKWTNRDAGIANLSDQEGTVAQAYTVPDNSQK